MAIKTNVLLCCKEGPETVLEAKTADLWRNDHGSSPGELDCVVKEMIHVERVHPLGSIHVYKV